MTGPPPRSNRRPRALKADDRAARRRTARLAVTLRRDDRAVAGVVGFILVFAAFITYASYVARSDVPKWGADAERSWDASVGDALTKLDRSAAAGLGSDASTTMTLPPAPAPRSTDIPLVNRFKADPPSGSLSFVPQCGWLNATHTLIGAASQVGDIVHGARGCLDFREQGSYSRSYGYRAEFGGLVRVERGVGFVTNGPVLQLTRSTTGAPSIVSATFLDLTGDSTSVGAGGNAGVPIDLVPEHALAESALVPNALSLSWNFTTPYADAWATWFITQFQQAGITSGATASASNGVVHVDISNPAGLALSISYGTYEVTIR